METYHEVTFNPSWLINQLNFDGASFPTVTITHPRHGKLTFVLSVNAATEFAAALTHYADAVASGRMKKAAPVRERAKK